ncbi:MAG: hypothetical protein ABIV04_03000 [Massilia sp.]
MTVNVPVFFCRDAAMPRPTFSLTDDQARLISSRVDQLQGAYPLDQRSHRPFVRGFMLAVAEATGNMYSPAIYQRLLAAFAPERKPSTATLASEKQALAAAVGASPSRSGATETGRAPETRDLAQLHLLMTDAIDAGLAKAARAAGLGNGAQADFYASRLRESEQQLAVLRAECSRLGEALAASSQSAQQHAQEAERAAAMAAAHGEAVLSLTSELADIRKFALQAIDEARGETRVWKERSIALEAQRQLDARLMETFRRLAYQRGAAVPDLLRQETKS